MRHAREPLAVFLFALAGGASIAATVLGRGHLPIPHAVARSVGLGLLVPGMLLAAWAAYTLGATVHGSVAPPSERLVTAGPYRVIRHPIYLGFLVALLGGGVMGRSLWGILASILLFLPVCHYRARLEEAALSSRFGSAWREYASSTWFLPPFLR